MQLVGQINTEITRDVAANGRRMAAHFLYGYFWLGCPGSGGARHRTVDEGVELSFAEPRVESRGAYAFRVAYEDVRFPARDGAAEIAGWYMPGASDAPVIVMVHGRDASRTAAVNGNFLQEAKVLHDGGFGVLMIDLRGHGQSSDARDAPNCTL